MSRYRHRTFAEPRDASDGQVLPYKKCTEGLLVRYRYLRAV